MNKFFDCGIDLGTTNSCIAVPNKDNTCDVILSKEQMLVTPSVVYVRPNGNDFVGYKAKSRIRHFGLKDVVREFKRDMGTDTVYHFKGANKQKTPIELSAQVLMQLKRDAEDRTGKKMLDVVVTVPAAFSMVQCEHTKKAASLAGFENTILLQEPIAAAVAYGAQPGSQEQYWLVFDYGGGTLDVSIISTKDGHLENINSCGNNRMGGKDLDRILYEEIILPKLKKEYNLANGLSAENTAKISLSVEETKIKLSSTQTVMFDTSDLEDVCDDDGTYIEFECEITRAEFEAAIGSIIDEAVAIAKKAVAESGLADKDISKILLVGGSTFIPLVREKLQHAFAIELDCSLNPMTVVAEGAALFAAVQTIDSSVPVEEQHGEFLLDFEYDPVSSNETENICGTIKGNEAGTIRKVMIECIASEESENALWSSGWSELLDVELGAFDIDIKICNFNGSNLYRISAIDATGSSVPLNGYLFEIVHKESALKVAAPPMPFALGVEANDGTRNVMSWFTEKNTKLPVHVVKRYHLDKALDPSTEDSCRLNFYEGEYTENPKANHLVGTVIIKSTDLNRKVNKGTEIEITIDIDISRNALVSAYLPELDIELFSGKELEDLGARVSVMRKMAEVENEIQKTRQTLNLLKKAGVPVGSLAQRFEEIAGEYGKYMDLVDVDNDSVLVYIQKFYAIQTEIIKIEIESKGTTENKDANAALKRAEDNINKYGNAESKQQLQNYKDQIERMHDPDSKRFLESKIDELETSVISNSFEWHVMVYNLLYESGFCTLKDKAKGEYWKNEARAAIARKDMHGLRNAIFQLQNLRVPTAGEAAGQDLSHLRII